MTPKVGDVLITKYNTTLNYIWHVSLIEKETDTSYFVYEGNYEKGKEGRREILKSSKEIVGGFDVELWKKINKLSPQLKAIIADESDYNHFQADGSVLIGDQGQSFGITQIQRRTWRWFNQLRKQEGLPSLSDILIADNQIEMLKWAEKTGRLDHWSCVKEKRDGCVPEKSG